MLMQTAVQLIGTPSLSRPVNTTAMTTCRDHDVTPTLRANLELDSGASGVFARQGESPSPQAPDADFVRSSGLLTKTRHDRDAEFSPRRTRSFSCEKQPTAEVR